MVTKTALESRVVMKAFQRGLVRIETPIGKRTDYETLRYEDLEGRDYDFLTGCKITILDNAIKFGESAWYWSDGLRSIGSSYRPGTAINQLEDMFETIAGGRVTLDP
jgi:hypothetical protein